MACAPVATCGHDDGGSHAAGGAYRTKQMDGIMAVVLHHQRAGTDRCPDIGMRALLTYASLILVPNLKRLACGGRAGKQCVLHQAGEVFLKAAWAA